MNDLPVRVADFICRNYKAGEVISTDRFDKICQDIGLKSYSELAKRVWRWKEWVNDILMQRKLWLFTVSPEYIKLVDVPEHILRTTAFTRLASEINKHANKASEQLEHFMSELTDRHKERALSKIVWEMESLSEEVSGKVLKIGDLRTEGMGLLEEWIKDSLPPKSE